MRRRKSWVGWIVLIIIIALVSFIWNEAQHQSAGSDGGLLNMIKGVGDGIARRMGRG